MAYISVSEIKQYLGISNDDDDALISSIIDSAEFWLKDELNRTPYTDTNTTHYFDVVEDVDGRTLFLDDDLAEINSVTTNADGTVDVLETTDYVTMPRNKAPYYAIKLLQSSDSIWTYTNDPETGIEVSGKWCFTIDIGWVKQAMRRLSSYAYRQKDSQIFDTIAIPDAGIITVPSGFPADVARWVRANRRR